MDVFSHGLWGGIAFGRKAKFGLAVTFGMLPDLLAFGPFFIMKTVTQGFGNYYSGRPPLEVFPQWVFTVYNLTHSLLVAGLVFAILWYWHRGVAVAFLTWPLHILFDIPTHTAAYFPTKFLYPLSTFHFDGVNWGNPLILLPNYLILAGLYAFFLFRRLKFKQ